MYPYIYFLGLRFSSYGLLMSVACVIVGGICLYRARRYDVLPEDVFIVAAIAIGCGLFCGGLLFTFVTYPLEYIWECVLSGHFEVFIGGIVFYGGLVGGIIGALLGCKIAGCSKERVIRIVVPYIPLGHAIGRIGCVLAGCCYGTPYDGPFAIYTVQDASNVAAKVGHFPVQIVESLINVGICILLYCYEKRGKANKLLVLYLFTYALIRFGLEFLRGDEIRGITAGLSSSQWISVLLIATSIALFCFWNWREKKHR